MSQPTTSTCGHRRVLLSVGLASAALAGLAAALVLLSRPAAAIPAFARQTGQGCPACHTNFPELTPFGRTFKLNAYTLSSGENPLPDFPPVASRFSAMVQSAFTTTRSSQPAKPTPDTGPNDNISLEAASVFYGGKLVDNLGAWVQATYSDTAKRVSWDNTDIRYARNLSLFDHDVLLGADFNNNPTVQDVYNTTPAFNFPWASGSLAPRPAAATVIEGNLAQQVGALGAYALTDDTLYAEFSLYKTLPYDVQRAFGIPTLTEKEIDGVAPYWRIALQRQFGDHALSAGTFGLFTPNQPSRIHGFGTDEFTDLGLDAQYQYLGEHHVVSLQGMYIQEDQRLSASQPLGFSNNARNWLNSLKLKGSYIYSRDWSKYALTAQYFAISGSQDTGLYAPGALTGSNNGRPNSNGWVFELDYLPFINRDTIGFWPWSQVKFSLQYTVYNTFNGASRNYDGSGRDASDNNTVFLLAWFAF